MKGNKKNQNNNLKNNNEEMILITNPRLIFFQYSKREKLKS